jgi:hypothetical protein
MMSLLIVLWTFHSLDCQGIKNEEGWELLVLILLHRYIASVVGDLFHLLYDSFESFGVVDS